MHANARVIADGYPIDNADAGVGNVLQTDLIRGHIYKIGCSADVQHLRSQLIDRMDWLFSLVHC